MEGYLGPTLGKGPVGKHLVAGLLLMGPGQVQPDMGPSSSGPTPSRRSQRSQVQCIMGRGRRWGPRHPGDLDVTALEPNS